MRAAPIALFVYNRPDHLSATIDSLLRCEGVAESEIHVFADGPRDEGDRHAVEAVRAVVLRKLAGRALCHFSDVNKGLSASITAGVSNVLSQHDRVIVLEDDLVLDARYLLFMNAALAAYESVPNVLQVSGYSPFSPSDGVSVCALLPWTSTWGWGTWKDAWQHYDPLAIGWQALSTDKTLRQRFNLNGAYDYAHMLESQMAGRRDSWGIRWYWSVFRRGGLVCYPPASLLRNSGFDGSGTHGRGLGRNRSISKSKSEVSAVHPFVFPAPAVLDREMTELAQRIVYHRNGGRWGRMRDKLNRVLRR